MFSFYYFIFEAESKTLDTTVEHIHRTESEDNKSPNPGFHAFSGLSNAVLHPYNTHSGPTLQLVSLMCQKRFS